MGDTSPGELLAAAKTLLGVDGAGLMLADARGQLRWATASDQQTQIIAERSGLVL